jgi:hypothetical protein
MQGSYDRGNQAVSAAVERLTVVAGPDAWTNYVVPEIYSNFFAQWTKCQAAKTMLGAAIEAGDWVFTSDPYAASNSTAITKSNLMDRMGVPTNWFDVTPRFNLAMETNGWRFIPTAMSNVVWTASDSSWSTTKVEALSQADGWIVNEDYNVTTSYYGSALLQCTNESQHADLVTALNNAAPAWMSDSINETYDVCALSPVGGSTTYDYGQTPSYSWSASVKVSDANINKTATWLAGPSSYRLEYLYREQVRGYWSSSRKSTRLSTTANDAPIARIDSYYYNGASFEDINVAGSTPASITTAYVDPLGESYGCATRIISVSLLADYVTYCSGTPYLYALSFNATNNVQDSGYTTQTGSGSGVDPEQCIHIWDFDWWGYFP